MTGDYNYDQFLEEINRLFMEKHNQNVNQTSTSNSAKTSIKEASFQEDHVDLSMKRFSESLKLDVKRTRRGKFPEGEKTDAEHVTPSSSELSKRQKMWRTQLHIQEDRWRTTEQDEKHESEYAELV